MDKNRLSDYNNIDLRAIALDILLALRTEGAKSHVLLKDTLDKYDYLPNTHKGFLKRLVNGSIEYRLLADYVIGCFSKTPVNKLKPVIREIFRMSIYQYLFMDSVPDSAVCNEAVRLTGARGLKGLKGYVNGVLRSVMRDYDSIKWPDKDKEPVKWLGVTYSCPELIVSGLLDDYGYDVTERVLRSSLSEAGVYVRIDESLGDEMIRAVKEELAAEGCIADGDIGNTGDVAGGIPDYAVKISEPEKLTGMSCFADGHIAVQDLSSMSVCEMAFDEILKGDRPADGYRVLDLCAAPGGKSMHAASKLRRYGMHGSILSFDISEHKLGITLDNIRRMRCDDMISTDISDATVYDEKLCESAYLVLADVPCSGLGVIGKKPDIKYNVTKQSLDEIVALQKSIIDNAVRYVKPGGVLVYSTCTMRRAENDKNAEYIASHEGFELKAVKQLYMEEGHDGFYTAVFRKTDGH